MSGAIDWDCLEQQFISDDRFQKEIVPMVFNSVSRAAMRADMNIEYDLHSLSFYI